MPQTGAGALRRGEPYDNHLLASAGLILSQSLLRAPEIGAVGTLGHDALKAKLARLVEQALAVLEPMLAVGQQGIFGQGGPQTTLALNERKAAQILAVEDMMSNTQ